MRSASDVARHEANAALAAATAASTSSADANATCLVTWPVAGSNTSPRARDDPVDELAVDPVGDERHAAAVMTTVSPRSAPIRYTDGMATLEMARFGESSKSDQADEIIRAARQSTGAGDRAQIPE